jgi:hypothetical protein
MNMLISNEFGQYFARLPLQKAAHIRHADALEIDWQTVVPKNELSYIIVISSETRLLLALKL